MFLLYCLYSPLLVRTLTGFQVHSINSVGSHLELLISITSSRALFLNKVTFTGTKVRTWTGLFGDQHLVYYNEVS